MKTEVNIEKMVFHGDDFCERYRFGGEGDKPVCGTPSIILPLMTGMSRSVRPSLVTEKSAVGQSNHHCGVDPECFISIIHRHHNLKQGFLWQR
jgi:hypothetical protein